MKTVISLWHYQKPAFFGLLVVAAMFVMAIIAPLIAPYHYLDQNLAEANLSPSREHLLGTDRVGRDQFSRIIYGARSAAFVVIATLALTTPLGLILGGVSGYLGGWIDTLIMRVADIMFSFPGFLLILFLSATLRPRIDTLGQTVGFLAPAVRGGYLDYIAVTLALSLVGWAGVARLVRSLFLQLKEEDYVLVAESIGATSWRIIFRHIMPNAMAPIIVSLSGSAGYTILTEASLAFLGLGIRPPNPSWGAMIYANYIFWRTRPWLLWGPGVVLTLVIAGFMLLGDGLISVLNPKEMRRKGK